MSERVEYLRTMAHQSTIATGSQLIRDLQQMLDMAEQGTCDLDSNTASERLIRFTSEAELLNRCSNTLATE